MFSKKECQDIMKNYNAIVKGDKKCTDYPLKKVIAASKGMHIAPVKLKKNQLCESIEKSYQNKADPIVHEDSLTAWGNQAAERYGLEIKDILSMKAGEKMDVILLDRNVGDYMHGAKKGTKYDPKKKGLSYATYIHGKNLTGILIMHDVGVVQECFEWEINSKSIGGPFWCSINCISKPCKIKPGRTSCEMKTEHADYQTIKDLDPKTKVGWRGPAIKLEDAKKLPKNVVHYDTWWDDYMPFRTHDFLKKSK